jgi:hypothetical protein
MTDEGERDSWPDSMIAAARLRRVSMIELMRQKERDRSLEGHSCVGQYDILVFFLFQGYYCYGLCISH